MLCVVLPTDQSKLGVVAIAHLHLEADGLTRTAEQIFHLRLRKLKIQRVLTVGVRPSSWDSSR